MTYGPIKQKDYGLIVNQILAAAPVVTSSYGVGGYSDISFGVSIESWSAISKLEMTCQVSYDGTTWYDVVDEVSGDQLIWTKDLSGNAAWFWTVNTEAVYIKATFTPTGDAGETLKVNAFVDASKNIGGAAGGGEGSTSEYLSTQTTNEIYVDKNRTDTYTANGSFTRPYKTIAEGVAKAVAIQTADSSVLPVVILYPGTYNEDLNLENANLTKIVVRSIVYKKESVTIAGLNALQMAVDTENLRYLLLEGLTFTNASEISCDVGGGSNVLFADGAYFNFCTFDDTLEVSKCGIVFFYNTWFNDDITSENAIRLHFQKCYFLNTKRLLSISDDTDLLPNGYVQSYVYVEHLSNVDFSATKPGTTGGVQVFVKGGGGAGSVNTYLGSGCGMTLYPGSFFYTASGTFDTGSTLTIYGGTFWRDNLTLNGTISIDAPLNTSDLRFNNRARMTDAVNLDIDTGTETVDEFADTDCDAVMWQFLVKKGTTLRSGIITACWDAVGDTIDDSGEDITSAVGVTTDLTLAVDISGDNVRLRATAASDDWQVKVLRHML